MADVLLGHENFAGRMPLSIPKSEDNLPFFDLNAKRITYDQWFGQRLLDRDGIEAAYPLGFGLSYTKFEIFDLEATTRKSKDTIEIRVKVSNAGSHHGRYIIQIYGTRTAADRPQRVLLGFTTTDLPSGSNNVVTLEVSTRPLHIWEDGVWIAPSGQVGLEVAPYSGAPESLTTNIVF